MKMVGEGDEELHDLQDKTTFASGSMQLAEADTCHFNWDLTSLDLDFLDELSGFKQFTAIFKALTSTHEDTRLIPEYRSFIPINQKKSLCSELLIDNSKPESSHVISLSILDLRFDLNAPLWARMYFFAAPAPPTKSMDSSFPFSPKPLSPQTPPSAAPTPPISASTSMSILTSSPSSSSTAPNKYSSTKTQVHPLAH
ncbi:uncharacterized protein MONOS_13664 [Monocercomonoides exilis]|uniref:uncharacterized protein n=1 Tax=Monocercomonoides exilis TaxID=2049356 RepID=UPI003559E8F5|nr:hypothetical protein MONOS_13664 [Monocercomonoides exilis]|eukprot:MONOS_13664.1-p1 / transcript=MONOS_13664.1 / gene=MONOS_13664 / organism=Monocercomonoides_exilis_PA203 / gene_product=unspecified product / transcript_product=unspecified product / location=Mono_scaffold00860:10936-11739(-) / protein_length=198 / sequence_SO=supercontig / SO=protein_coding / is_pseudo=false